MAAAAATTTAAAATAALFLEIGLLGNAAGQTKLAILLQLTGCSAEEGQQLLRQSDGRLGKLLKDLSHDNSTEIRTTIKN